MKQINLETFTKQLPYVHTLSAIQENDSIPPTVLQKTHPKIKRQSLQPYPTSLLGKGDS